MAAAYRSGSSPIIATAAGPVTQTEPSGSVTGDVEIGFMLVESSGDPVVLPTSWTAIGAADTPTNFRPRIGYIVRGASAPSYAFNKTGSGYHEVYVAALSGVDNTTPIRATGTPNMPGVSGTEPTPPAVAGGQVGDIAVVFWGYWGGAPNGGWGAPSGYTPGAYDTGNLNAAGAYATKVLTSSGTETPGQFTGTPVGADFGWAQTVIFAAASGGGGGGTSGAYVTRRFPLGV